MRGPSGPKPCQHQQLLMPQTAGGHPKPTSQFLSGVLGGSHLTLAEMTDLCSQTLNVTEQLDAGVRYLDLRIAHMLEGSEKNLHFVHLVYTTALVEVRCKGHGPRCAVWGRPQPDVCVPDGRCQPLSTKHGQSLPPCLSED